MRRGGNNQGQGRKITATGCGPRLVPLACAMAVAAAAVPSIAAAQVPPPPQQESSEQAQPAGMELSAEERTEVARMMQELAALKAAYSQEVRRLRDLDMQMQALQARISGRAPSAPAAPPPQAAPVTPAPPPDTAQAQAAAPPPEAGYASTAEDAERAREEEARSVSDVRQQQQALFNQRLVIDNGVSYNRYDRKQLTLNGFLALDAIFLGNIAIENVESDTFTYNLAVRWGVAPRLTLNLDVPWIWRRTVYQKGGAGGAAAVIAQEHTSGSGLGDITASANYRLFTERKFLPEAVLTMGVTAPTGREPYGIPWRVLERDEDDFIRFAVPEEQPTGNGVWQASASLSAVKATEPAILFGNIGYTHSFAGSFDDLDNNPATVNPGKVKLGRAFTLGAGVAFAFNERTSLSIAYNNRFNARARTRYDEAGEWTKLIGTDGNAATLSLGVTHALSPQATFVGMLGIGLTPDAPDFSLNFKVPYTL